MNNDRSEPLESSGLHTDRFASRGNKFALLPVLLLMLAPVLHAELRLPAIIGDHMVLQQNLPNPLWGWDAPGTQVTVTFAGQTKSTQAGPDGKWTVKLDAVSANDKPQTLTITGTEKREIQDVLVGEVWMCSGQSNMGFTLAGDWKGDIEAAASRLPNLRLIKVPQVGTQELQNDFKGQWRASTSETARNFSAVGFYFGRYVHAILGVPVGLIDNSWGGSAAEAWVRRESLENDARFKSLMESTAKQEAYLQSEKAKADYETQVARWEESVEKAKAEQKPAAPAFLPVPVAHRQRAPRQHFLRRGLSHARLWHQGRHLVSGRIQRRARLGVRGSLPLRDRGVAQGMEPRRLPVLLGATGKLHGAEARAGREQLGGTARITDQDLEAS